MAAKIRCVPVQEIFCPIAVCQLRRFQTEIVCQFRRLKEGGHKSVSRIKVSTCLALRWIQRQASLKAGYSGINGFGYFRYYESRRLCRHKIGQETQHCDNVSASTI